MIGLKKIWLEFNYRLFKFFYQMTDEQAEALSDNQILLRIKIYNSLTIISMALAFSNALPLFYANFAMGELGSIPSATAIFSPLPIMGILFFYEVFLLKRLG